MTPTQSGVVALLKQGGGESSMQLIKEYRVRAALCRAQAANNPQHRDLWLAEARSWSQKADDEIASHFHECNSTSSDENKSR
jgi:hypothetical protein